MSAADSPHAVTVSVVVRYVPDQSDEDKDRYTFSYTITISNHGDSTVQLLSRYWLITDSNYKVQEVRGEGVVGEQPVLASGESFEYTSGVVLATPVGAMRGSYTMRAENDERFDVPIQQFVLSVPRTLH